MVQILVSKLRAIVEALAAAGHADAAQRLRENLSGGLADLTGALEG